LFEKLIKTSESLIEDSELISDDRKDLLDELSIYIKGKLVSKNEVNLVFICTHNSRRSHMAQLWAQAAANYFHIENIKTFSGGTQKTSFNKSAVNVLKNAGFKIKEIKGGNNPKYKVRLSKKDEPVICFSKVYSHKKNPVEGFAAIMTCSDADEACPVINGAEYRTSIKYEDPKKFDGTSQEEAAYLERSRQIGAEMFYVLNKVSELLEP